MLVRAPRAPCWSGATREVTFQKVRHFNPVDRLFHLVFFTMLCLLLTLIGDYVKYACGMVCEYLPKELANELEDSYR